MDLQEMFSKMASGEVKAHSELGTRDEAKQSRTFGNRIQKMKTVTNISAHVLVMKDVVIPFNPFTGKPDDEYNRKSTYRPILLVSQVIEGIKSVCATNPDLKAFWLGELGLSDFSEGRATMEEYLAFKAHGYIKPRIMSYPTVTLNFAGQHGFPEFASKYTVDPSQLNANNTYDYENAPIWHQLGILFNGILRKEADEITKKLEAQNAGKEAIKQERRNIFSKAPVQFVKPTNLMPFLYFPVSELPEDLDPSHYEQLEPHIRYYGFVDKWLLALQESLTNPMYDDNIDFFDFHLRTPSSKEVHDGKVYSDDDPNAIFQAMTISNTDGRLSVTTGQTIVDGKTYDNSEVYTKVFETARAYFAWSQQQSIENTGESFEQLMASSNRFRPITRVLEQLPAACNDIFSKHYATSPYFTEEYRNANSEALTFINPANALLLAAADEEDLSAAKDEQRTSVNDMLQELTPQGQVSEDLAALGLEGVATEQEMDFA